MYLYAMIFSVNTISAKLFLASCPFNKKMPLPSAIWPNFWDPLTLKIFLAYEYSIKKYIYYSIIWRWAVLCKKQDGSWIKICEIFSGKSLKKDLSIDTTFDLCNFSCDRTFKTLNFLYSLQSVCSMFDVFYLKNWWN